MFKRVGRKKHPNWSGIVDEIEKEFDTTVAKRLPEYPKKVTANWEHKPDFPTKKRKSKQAIRMECAPAGPNEKFWIWTTAGTPRHPITPKKATVLAFPSVYVPKTKRAGPVGSFGGPGRSSGPTVFAKEVKDHPGTDPRRFVGPWARLAMVWFRLAMQGAVARGASRA